MKLSGAEAARYFAKPDPGRAGLLIFGADAMAVALRRQEVIAALIGPKGEEEMRLTRMSGADLRKDGTLLLDAIKSAGFFPGPRVAFVEEATDGLADAIAAALKEWKPGDANVVITAGNLTAKSALKVLMEKHLAADLHRTLRRPAQPRRGRGAAGQGGAQGGGTCGDDRSFDAVARP